MTRKRKPDVVIRDEGSLLLFDLRTEQARGWVEEHVAEDAQRFGRALVVEHRYAGELTDGMAEAGLTVELR